MIGRLHRFHGHGSLRFVYKSGQTIRASSYAIKYIYNPRRKRYRVAVVVSKKVSKSAVVRNRIRRRIYEVIRSQQSAITKPYDIVVTVFSEKVTDLPAPLLATDMTTNLKKAGII